MRERERERERSYGVLGFLELWFRHWVEREGEWESKIDNSQGEEVFMGGNVTRECLEMEFN